MRATAYAHPNVPAGPRHLDCVAGGGRGFVDQAVYGMLVSECSGC